ncbi:hypothetical protein HPP92_002044 [Vanilla planifolia]|uniref:Chlororespiratory reduction 4 n=1 Tax=Vanilla planifolia TaxID=51239 RepID=A0A835RV52_VANPL|nr:hypothetical protein HPP92_002044 [Vanilla planifolia]
MADACSPLEMEKRLITLLQGCKDLRELKQIHLQVLVNGLGESCHLLPKLMDVSSSCNCVDYSIQIFQTAKSPNVVVHNTMIKHFVQNGCQSEAFDVYKEMRVRKILPNNFTFTFLLKACQSLASLCCCEELHAQLVKHRFGSLVYVQNVLLCVYSSCAKDPSFACRVFDEMLQRDVVSWNSLVSAYVFHGNMERAIKLFNSMPVRNIVSWNLVISALSKTGDMALARSLFDRMTMKNTLSWNAIITGYVAIGDVESARSIFEQSWDKDVFSWTTMISGYAQAGHMDSARKLFDSMPLKNPVSWNAVISGYNKNFRFDEALVMFQLMLIDGKCPPNEATFTSVVSTISHLGSLEHGRWINSYIKKNNIPLTITLSNALIDMFAKCGDIKNSELVFDQMTRRCIITWTTMISGLALNGQCREAVALFHRFCREGSFPDDVIFIAALSACTHGGLLEEGHQIFDLMAGKYGIQPRMEHYGCMVDLLGRMGKFDEAIEFICKMQMEPNVVIWATLLSSSNVHGAVVVMDAVRGKVKGFDCLEAAYQVLVSNSSAREGVWHRVVDVRARMREKGLQKVPGCSLIQLGGEVHEFMVEDAAHWRREDIYHVLHDWTDHARQMGCVLHM